MTPDETIAWIKEALTEDTPLRAMYKKQKSELFVEWGDALEQKIIAGELDIKIYKIANYIRKELIAIGLEQAIDLMYHVMPAKFKHASDYYEEEKDEFLSKSVNVENSTKNSSKDFSKENKNYIVRLQETRKLLAEFEEKLENNEFVEKIDNIEEFFTRWDNSLNRAREVLDGREKVPVSTQHLLFYAMSTSTLNHAYAEYLIHVKNMASITSKQAGKILKGHVSEIQLLYEPKNKTEAMNSGFYGQACEECGSFRTVYKYHTDNTEFMTKCFACGHWQPAKTEKLLTKEISE